MAFRVTVAPEAVEDLRRLTADQRARVRAGLERHLRYGPTAVGKSRVKRLRKLTQPQYRLRIDEMRVYYNVDLVATEVLVLAILPKPDAEEWLSQVGVSP